MERIIVAKALDGQRTVLLKKFSVESHITVGFSAFLSSIGVYEHVTSKNKIIPRALFEQSSK